MGQGLARSEVRNSEKIGPTDPVYKEEAREMKSVRCLQVEYVGRYQRIGGKHVSAYAGMTTLFRVYKYIYMYTVYVYMCVFLCVFGLVIVHML